MTSRSRGSRIVRGAAMLSVSSGMCLAWSTGAAAQSEPSSAAPDAQTPATPVAPSIATVPPIEADGAQVGLEDIIVTAQKRAQNLQDVPVAVSAFTEEGLLSRGITNVGELTRVTPGLTVAQGTGVVLPFLRGIGSNASAAGNESSVAVYADGVYFTRLPLGFLSLNNIERVEVLKGPQGTLFGRNASGGVINIITRDPSFDFAGHGSVGYGNYQTFRGNLYLTGGLTDTLAMNVSVGGQYQADGWGTNILTGENTGFQNDFTARAKLMFKPDELTKFVLTGYYSFSRVSTQGNTVPGFTRGTRLPPYQVETTLPDFYDVSNSVEGRNETKGEGVSFRAEHDFGFGTLVSTTAYTAERELQPGDQDLTIRDDGTYLLHIGVTQFTQELQLGGKVGDLTYVAGLFYYDAISKYDPSDFTGELFAPFNTQLFSRQRARSYAGYTQMTYDVTSRFRITGGLRYTHEITSGSGRTVLRQNGAQVAEIPTPPDKTKLDKLTFRGALDYRFSDQVLGYVSYSRGYKSGGYNLIPFTAPAQRPEVVDALEAGFKTDLFDRRLRLNAAAFRYWIEDPQVQLIRAGSIVLSNAESATVKGVEFDAEAAVTPELSLRGGFTYLDSRYKSYVDAPSLPPNTNTDPDQGYIGGTAPIISVDASGNRTPLAPEAVFNIGGNYRIGTEAGDFDLSVDYYHTSRVFFEPDNLLSQSGYGLLSAQVKFSPMENLDLRIWGRNLTGKEYISLGVSYSGPSGYPYLPGPPRTVGVAADFRF